MKLLIFSLLTFFSLQLSSQEIDHNNCKNSINGNVINKHTKSEIANALIQIKLNGKIIDELHSDSEGKFKLNLDCNKRYQISAVYENYSKAIKLIFTNLTNDFSNIINLEMIPVNEFKINDGKKVLVMDPIYFDTDDFSISKETSLQLDMVAELMSKYPHLTIEIGFHTNNMGDLNYLKSLSQNRADACATYLYEKGIEQTRIVARGYGFTNPVKDCLKESMKENKEKCISNVRTEFLVVSDIIE